jgi:LPS sulfotransferase NodH
VPPSASKKNIVVCGYPKSGTTWVSRLVAELVGCPFQGDLGGGDGGPLEGGMRASDYDCYKTHRGLPSLVSELPAGDVARIVYVVRDPRDIAISAAHHFRVTPLRLQPGGNRIVAALNARLSRAVPHSVKIRRMIRAVLYGDASSHYWLSRSWRDHYREFRPSDALLLKYEDLLADPLARCAEILAYLDLPGPRERIASAIANQSFDHKKSYFKAQGMLAEQAFLRRGGTGYWRGELDSTQQRLFVDQVGEDLDALSYPLE